MKATTPFGMTEVIAPGRATSIRSEHDGTGDGGPRLFAGHSTPDTGDGGHLMFAGRSTPDTGDGGHMLSA